MPSILESTGMLFRRSSDGTEEFLGTCFALGKPPYVLTATHCIGTLNAAELTVSYFYTDWAQGVPVTSISRHPQADLAVLRVPTLEMQHVNGFAEIGGRAEWGAPFCAVGFPEDTTVVSTPRSDYGIQTTGPTARFFRGNLQRLMYHTSHLGYRYFAYELSIGAPAGLSGGPVFLPENPNQAIGLVTESVESTTYLRTLEEIQEPGRHYREVVHATINYGVAVDLSSIRDWVIELGTSSCDSA